MSSARTPPKSRSPRKPLPPVPPPKNPSASKVESTNVWGSLEANNSLKDPKIVFRLGRYGGPACENLKARHLLLMLVLAHHRFEDKPIRAYWIELAQDLGVSEETVRKWGYQLQKNGLAENPTKPWPLPRDEQTGNSKRAQHF